MSSPFLAEIRMLPYMFAPRDWADCSGTLIPLQQNSALFALIGVIYGGNGQTNFALPDLRGRAPLHVGGQNGQKLPLSYHQIGGKSGTTTVTLTEQTIPSHSHGITAANTLLGKLTDTATDTTYLSNWSGGFAYLPNFSGTNAVPLNEETIGVSGGQNGAALAHENRQPFLALRFCICVDGMFPMRAN
ncbi:MAG: tail fiber protein [Gammaproteobacteria bacterium]|nr:tail fiber protein [Gammaproteobacteria bacterium]MBU2057780.1 tail fiber protein [Gammaproteobacteria bacterium]MBU2174440.1 tail fiber protein [Gammaproteobacteria bacterium]MBU2245806.1 tail fiber protein [Gammaproteobacteria bacterium]MBU2344378.1 tail fiber protein [Gammaproteobacteria bacterium]